MKVTKQETLYHEDHGATLKHKCGKKDSSIVPFYFLFFLGLPFFNWPFSLYFFIFIGTMLYEWWSSHFYLFTTQWLQLDTRTKYASIWMPPTVYRDGQWIKSDMYEKLWMVALPQIRCQLHDHAKQYDNDECVGERCRKQKNSYGFTKIHLGVHLATSD